MKNIVFKTKYLTYEISRDGRSAAFTTADGESRLTDAPCAVIAENDRSIIPTVGASLSDDRLTLRFADGTVCVLLTEVTEEYITFTIESVSCEDFLYISFVNISLTERKGDFEAVLMGMTAATKMEEHPGDNERLIASAYPHIGITSTKRSDLPAKAAFFAAPRERVREIERKILDTIPEGEIPRSRLGGPYADNASEAARESYFILMQDTATPEKVDGIIEQMRRFGLTQITLHHNSHYRQGDFLPRRSKFPNGVSDFKRVVDRFHENGIKVGLQTYSFFLSKASKYVTPIPHPDLDVIRSFTLSGDISEDALTLSVNGDTEGVTANEGFIYVNSPYLWIDNELIKFSRCEDGRFTLTERGALGTHPAPHTRGSEVKQLKEYFLLPLARAGSELFYEIARNTAEFYNETGADYFYLDALDGAFVLDGEDYVWYHAMDFVREMFKHLRRDIIFDCCYNPQYTGTWYVRSRYGAVDVSLNSHRLYFDAHTEYNERTAARMGITAELGWIDLFPHADDPKKFWLNEPLFPEDLEYVSSKAFAEGASLAFLENFRRHGPLPLAESLSSVLRKYKEYRKTALPTEETKKYLLRSGSGAVLRDGRLYASRISTMTFEEGCPRVELYSSFDGQIPEFRLQALRAADSYYHPSAVTLLELDETKPITEDIRIKLDTPIAARGNHGLGVYCYGDGSGAVVTVGLRNRKLNSGKLSEHYIKCDFVGWKYFAFYESQNGLLDSEHIKPKGLEYKSYNQLQEFYGYYRAKLDYEALDGVEITVRGSDNIRLRSLRLLPHVCPEIVNPTLRFGDTGIRVLTRLAADTCLYFDGKECTVTDLFGNVLARPAFVGIPKVDKGKCKITLEAENENPDYRARLTIITLGEILQ